MGTNTSSPPALKSRIIGVNLTLQFNLFMYVSLYGNERSAQFVLGSLGWQGVKRSVTHLSQDCLNELGRASLFGPI